MTIILKDMDMRGFKILLEWYSKIDEESKNEFLVRVEDIITIIPETVQKDCCEK